MEYQIFQVEGAFKREILTLFQKLKRSDNINIVLFFQDTGTSLLNRSDNSEKDECLIRFFEIAEKLCDELSEYWCDYFDPSSGLSMKSDSMIFFSDVEACSRLMKVNYVNCAGCMLINHQKFGTNFYPSSFITIAPIELVKLKLEKILPGL